MHHKHEGSLPWRGYDRGLIICLTCGFANADDLARKNKIQSCDQCGKTVYIPSGLYNKHKANTKRFKHKRRLPNPIFELFDIIGAAWNKFMHSAAKWPVLLGLCVLALAGLGGSYFYKTVLSQPPRATPAILTYYNRMLPLESQLSNSLDTFNQDSGGGGEVQKGDYDKWSVKSLDQASSGRFVRNVSVLLNTVEGMIVQVNSMTDVPADAQAFHASFLKTLACYQIYYARLKDGIKDSRQDIWNSAFDAQSDLRSEVKTQDQAFAELRQIVINLDHAA
jgi:hypothetical protein